MARGGKRTGTPGTNYANRSDLRTPAPPVAPTGLPYGEHAQLAAAQKAVPTGPAPVPGASPGQARPAPTPIRQPGTLPWMHPTNRPNEPVQAGLASGPGPGPEALRGVGQNLGQAPDNTKALLGALAQQPNAPEAVKQLASYAQAGRG